MDWRAAWKRGVVAFATVWVDFRVMISIFLSAREVSPAVCRRPPPRVRFFWPGTDGRRERRGFAGPEPRAVRPRERAWGGPTLSRRTASGLNRAHPRGRTQTQRWPVP